MMEKYRSALQMLSASHHTDIKKKKDSLKTYTAPTLLSQEIWFES